MVIIEGAQFRGVPGSTTSLNVTLLSPPHGTVRTGLFDLDILPCTPGHFESPAGAGTFLCSPCPSGTTTLHQDATSCDRCPSTVVCRGGNDTASRFGYWRESHNTLFTVGCTFPDACLGAYNPDFPNQKANIRSGSMWFEVDQCATGYSGNVCAKCADDNHFAKASGVCHPCPSTASSVTLLIFGLLLLWVGLFVWVSRIIEAQTSADGDGMEKDLASVTIRVKLFVSCIQLVSMVSSLPVEWPTWLESALLGQKAVTSLSDELISLPCLLQGGGIPAVYSRALIYCLSPLFGCVFAWSISYVGYALSSKSISGKSSLFSRPGMRFRVALIIFAFLGYPRVTQEVLSLFICREVVPGKYYLNTALQQQCWVTPHLLWLLLLGLPVLLLYVLGLPILVLWTLRQSHMSDELMTPFHSFMAGGYRDGFRWWEMTVLLRKVIILFIFIGAPVFGSAVSQVVTATVVVCIFFIIHMYTEPFEDEKANRFETISLALTMTTFQSISLLAWQDVDEGLLTAACVIVALMNAAYWVYGLVNVSPIVWHVVSKAFGKCMKRGKSGSASIEKESLKQPLLPLGSESRPLCLLLLLAFCIPATDALYIEIGHDGSDVTDCGQYTETVSTC
jgi:hypothetical protein